MQGRAAPPQIFQGGAIPAALSPREDQASSAPPSPLVSPRLSARSVTAAATVSFTATVTVEATASVGLDGEERVTLEQVGERGRAEHSSVSSEYQAEYSDVVSSVSGVSSRGGNAAGPGARSTGGPRASGSPAKAAIKGRRGAEGGPSVMRAALNKTRTMRAMFENKVICSGWLQASKGVAGGARGRTSLLEGQLGAGYRPRWFAIVAFDRGGLMDKHQRLELVLLWTATEEKFNQLLEQLQESEDVPNSYCLKLQSGGSALRLPQVLGSLLLRSTKKVMESRRLDLPDNLFSAIEIDTAGKKYLLGVENQEDLSRWLHALRASKQRVLRPKSMKSGLRRSMTSQAPDKEEELECNKWAQEVGMPRLFHFLWWVLLLFSFIWIFSLVWLFNPYLTPCRHSVDTYADETTGQCLERDGGLAVEHCQSWARQAEAMGFWRSWVSELQSSGFFEPELALDGSNQTCFEQAGAWELFWFWGFVIVEIISKASTLGFSQLNWRVIVRGARTLDEMEPAFPERHWPDVDILLCHYSEPADETMETLSNMLELDYPPSKLHIYICDDGYLKSDFSEVDAASGVRWPTHRNNHNLIRESGDVRQLTEDLMAEHAEMSEHDGGVVGVMSEASFSPRLTDGTGQRQILKYKKTKETLPEPTDAEPAVPRIDCAVGYVQDTYSLPGMPTVSYVARLKPKVHHAKAGNINNALYNAGSKGQYIVVFDNDMQPHPKFLISTLPLFFETREAEVDDADDEEVENESPYTDDPKFNQLAFVQTPQYFKANWLMSERGDPLSHSNAAFFESGLQGMDGYNSVMFVGTNCVWRREALDSIGGVQYGTVSEDFWTGYNAQRLGWDGAYMRKDRQGPKEHRFRLSEGNVPESVAASMAQRKRWHKGSVELFLGAASSRDSEWVPPAARTPQRPVQSRVRRYRQAHYRLLCLAWINVFPPLFYTALVVQGLFTNALWIYLNPLPSYCVMIPFLLLVSLTPSLGDITVPTAQIMSSLPEYFTYAPVRLAGTFEAFYSKATGKAMSWGNTGGIRSGSWSEVPIMLIVVALAAGLVHSALKFIFFDAEASLSEVLPIWAFACYLLGIYWNIARVSLQEFLEWGYESLSSALLAHWLLVPGVMAVTVLVRWKEQQDWICIWTS